MWMQTKTMFATTMKTETGLVYVMDKGRAAGWEMAMEWETGKVVNPDNAAEVVEEDHNLMNEVF
jgi:hypothetical protein